MRTRLGIPGGWDFKDDFSRPDNASSAGDMDTGVPWEALAGTWAIKDSGLRKAAADADGKLVADLGACDGIIQCKLLVATNGHGLAFRYAGTDTANGYLLLAEPPVGRWTVYREDSVGGNVSLGTVGPAPANGDVISVVFQHTAILCFVNGVKILELSDDYHMDHTKVGFREHFAAAAAQFDEFRFRRL